MTPASLRDRALNRALITSLASKSVGILLQIWAFPLAAKALGVADFGIYAVAAGVCSLLSNADLGIGPAVTSRIASAVACGDIKSEAETFRIASKVILIVISSLLCAVAGFECLTSLGGPWLSLLGQSSLLRGGMLEVAVLISMLMCIASLGNRLRAGYQEVHVGNLFGIAANVVVLGLLLGIVTTKTTGVALLLIVYGVPAVFGVLNLGLLVLKRRYLLADFSTVWASRVGGVMRDGIGFLVVNSATGWEREIGKMMILYVVGASGVAQVSMALHVNNVLGGCLTMFTLPALPAIMDASVRSDKRWLSSRIRQLLWLGMGLGFTGFLLTSFGGNWGIKRLIGPEFAGGRLLFFVCGLQFLGAACAHVRSIILVGISGSVKVARYSFLQMLLTIFMSGGLVLVFGVIGVVVAQLISIVVVGIFLQGRAVSRYLANS